MKNNRKGDSSLTNTTITNIQEYTQKKLKAHYQNNGEFNQEIATYFEFYKKRLSAFLDESKQEKMEDMLFASVKSQIFNGYFMALELMNSEEATFEDDWFRQAEGMVAQQIPDMLRIATNNNIDEIITHEHLTELARWLVVEYEGVYPVLMDISLNTACMGAKWAFKDEAEKRGIQFYSSQYKGILANLDDVTFITPQYYINLTVTNELSEVWEVINSNYKELEKIGEVTVIKVNKELDKFGYYLNVTVKDQLSFEEKNSFIESIAVRLLVMNEIKREDLLLTSSTIVAFYQYQQ